MIRRHAPRRGRRLGPATATAALLVVLAAPPAIGLWSDTATVATGSSTGHRLSAPASTTCSAGLTAVTIGWPQTDARYRFSATLYRVGSPRVLVDGPTLLPAGQTSVTYSALLSIGPTYEVDVRSVLTAQTAWQSAAARTSGRFQVGLITATCL